MSEQKTLLDEIESFCAARGMADSAFGRWALKNPNFVSDLRRDDFSPLMKTVDKVRKKMKNYKPNVSEQGEENGFGIL